MLVVMPNHGLLKNSEPWQHPVERACSPFIRSTTVDRATWHVFSVGNLPRWLYSWQLPLNMQRCSRIVLSLDCHESVLFWFFRVVPCSYRFLALSLISSSLPRQNWLAGKMAGRTESCHSSSIGTSVAHGFHPPHPLRKTQLQNAML